MDSNLGSKINEHAGRASETTDEKVADHHPSAVTEDGQSNLVYFSGKNNSDQTNKQRDLATMRDPTRATPQELRECLQRHFPMDALISGDLSEHVMEELRHAYSLGGTLPEQNDTREKLPPNGLLGFYIMQMLRSDCPLSEREIFCKLVEALMQGYARETNEHMFVVFLGQIFADSWTGWAGAEGKSVADVSRIWHSSEIYRYLMNGEPPTSPNLIVRIEVMNKK